MNFWSLAWEYRWVTLEQLKLVVKTENNKFGEITPKEYKDITKVEFITQ
ncbi:XkdX family protein [Clostridium tepidum]